MPSVYNMPAAFGNTAMEDKDQFSKLPYYLVLNEIQEFAKWNIWDMLTGTIPWQPNNGTTMRATTPQPSPVGAQTFRPNNITEAPLKNIYGVHEKTEEARVKWHRYESLPFSFHASFQDFWANQVKYKNSDIVRQVQVQNNLFVRTALWDRVPLVCLAGSSGTNQIESAPYILEGSGSLGKDSNWLGTNLPRVKTNLNLSLLSRVAQELRDDIQAPFFEGVNNMPKDDAGFKGGKYVLVTSLEAWQMFPFDRTLRDLRSINLELAMEYFTGSLFGYLTAKFDPFPMRFTAAGVMHPPQIILDESVSGRGSKQIIANPDYTNPATSPYEVAWLLGADFMKTIKVGPPPREFTKQISGSKFYSLQWNGEVQMTDQIPIVTKDGSGNVTDVDLNYYGTMLKFISQVTHGALACQPRNAIPIIFERARVNPISNT